MNTDKHRWSFIVKFPCEPKSAEEVRNILFGEATKYCSPYNNVFWGTMKVAETVFNDIQEQNANQIDESVKLLTGNCELKYEDFEKTPGDWKSCDWEGYNKACDDWAKIEFEKFYSLKKIRRDKLSKIEGKDVTDSGEVVFIFEYGDESGQYYSDLEHGDLFEKLEHIVISQH